MRFSASMLGKWMDCPLQAKFHYIDRLPGRENAAAYFGKCIHAALENYAQTRDPDTAVAFFTTMWQDPDELGPEVVWPRTTSFGGYQSLAQQIIRTYDQVMRWETRTILGTEHAFCVPFGMHELQGYVDLLEVSKNAKGKKRLKIIDYKTASRQPSRVALTQNVQFSAYYFASLQPEFWMGIGKDASEEDQAKFPGFPNGEELYEEYKDVERSAIWYQLRTNKAIDAGPRDDNDFMRLYRAAKEIERAIKHEVFVPDISADSCGFCPYHEPCGLPIKEGFDD